MSKVLSDLFRGGKSSSKSLKCGGNVVLSFVIAAKHRENFKMLKT